MTTIATDGKSMAADGYCTGNGLVFDTEAKKVRRLKDGRIVGMTGSLYDMEVFVDWLNTGGDCPVIENEFEALVLAHDGTVRSFDKKGRSIAMPPLSVTGCGQDLALGAMLAGASPERAVEIACERNVHTGGKITVLHIGDAE